MLLEQALLGGRGGRGGGGGGGGGGAGGGGGLDASRGVSPGRSLQLTETGLPCIEGNAEKCDMWGQTILEKGGVDYHLLFGDAWVDGRRVLCRRQRGGGSGGGGGGGGGGRLLHHVELLLEGSDLQKRAPSVSVRPPVKWYEVRVSIKGSRVRLPVMCEPQTREGWESSDESDI